MGFHFGHNGLIIGKLAFGIIMENASNAGVIELRDRLVDVSAFRFSQLQYPSKK
jgi:hypothetical protein